MYRTLDDRYFILTSTNPARDWPLLAQTMGHPEWLTDPLFATPMDRFANSGILVGWLDEIFAAETFDHWRDVLSAGGVTFGIVGQIYDHLGDPQIEANGLFPEIVDSMGLRTVDSPFQISGADKNQPRMAPEIGEHSRAILEEFGCPPADIEALLAE